MTDFAISRTRSIVGIHARPVCVEVHLSFGLPGFSIVGLPEAAVKESRDRVRSAIINSQYDFPYHKITVNLAPADLPKAGSGFDLPIALGILAASGQIPPENLEQHEFIGELALNGQLRGVPAIIPAVIAARKEQQTLVIAQDNAQEAALVGGDQILFAHHLRQVCGYLCKKITLEPLPTRPMNSQKAYDMDFSDVRGQQQAKQALTIAAAGGHNVLLYGPPGSGKTMLAKRFATILPVLSEEQALESAAIHSLQGRTPDFAVWRNPTFRAPHHTASSAALVGGGNPPKPGEISLAHHGVLFLDELPEFSRNVLETLREPLESGQICISRASMQTEFPAKFQLLCAMNPCPCGHWGNTETPCRCSPERVNRYLGKLSAPFLDRIDLQINVSALPQATLIEPHLTSEPESPLIRAKIQTIRQQQYDRQGCLNAHLSAKAGEAACRLTQKERDFLQQALTRLKLSARAYHRLLKVARTIADLKEVPSVGLGELNQALLFKQTLTMPGLSSSPYQANRNQ